MSTKGYSTTPPLPTKKKKPPATPKVSSSVVSTEERKAATAVSSGGQTKISKETKKAFKSTPSVINQTAQVVSTEERKAATKPAKKKDLALLGYTKPKGKKQKRLKSKGQAIRDIFKAAGQEAEVDDIQSLKDVPTQQIRAAKLTELQSFTKKAKKSLPNLGETKGGASAHGAVVSNRALVLNSQIKQAELGITKLKKQMVQDGIKHTKKNIDTIKDFKGKDKYDQEKVKTALAQQRKGLNKLQEKKEKLKDKQEERKAESTTASEGVTGMYTKISKNLEGAEAGHSFTDTFLGEMGIRSRGERAGKEPEYKIPGIPGWQSYETSDPVWTTGGSVATAIELGTLAIAPAKLAQIAKAGVQAGSKISFAVPALAGARKVAAPAAGILRTPGLTAARIGAKDLSLKFGSKATLGIDALREVGAKVASTRAAQVFAKIREPAPVGDDIISMGIRAEGQGMVPRTVGEVAGRINAKGIPSAAKIRSRTGAVMAQAPKAAEPVTKARFDKTAAGIDDIINGAVIKYAALATRPTMEMGKAVGIKWGTNVAKYGSIAGVGSTAIPILTADDADLAKRIYRDSYDIIVGFVPTTYQMLAAGAEAVRGAIPGFEDSSTTRAEAMWGVMREHDPVVLAVRSMLEDDDGELWSKAIKEFNQRPVSGFLELAGAEYVIGRSIGAGMRMTPGAKYDVEGNAANLRALAKESAGVWRAQKIGPAETKAWVEKSYSPDVFRKAFQRSVERVEPDVLKRSNEKYQMIKAVDEDHAVFRSRTTRMINQIMEDHKKLYKEAYKIAQQGRKDGRLGPQSIPFMASKIVRPPTKADPSRAHRDLAVYRSDLIDEINADPFSLASDYTRATVKSIDEILKRPEILNDSRLWDVAEKYKQIDDPVQERLMQHSALNKVQSRFARWVPYMVRHLGATQNHDGTWNIKIPEKDFAYKNVEFVDPKDLLPYLELDRRPGAKAQKRRSGKFGPSQNVGARQEYWDELRTSIEKEGINEEIIFSYNPDTGTGFISEGNHRLSLAIELGLDSIPVRGYRYSGKSEWVGKGKPVPKKHTPEPRPEGHPEGIPWTPHFNQDFKVSDVGFKSKEPKRKIDPNKPHDMEYLEAIAAAEGVSVPGFFSMQTKVNDLSKKNAKLTGKQAHFFSRSAASTRYGLFDPSYDALFSHSMRIGHTINDSQFIRNFVDQYSPFRDRNGKLITGSYSEINELIRKKGQGTKHGEPEELVPFNVEGVEGRLASNRGFGDDVYSVTSIGEYGSSASGNLLDAIEQGLVEKGKGVYAAMPADAIRRVQQHAGVDTKFSDSVVGRGVRRLTREFKGGVLPFNPRWQLGNVADMALRLMVTSTPTAIGSALNPLNLLEPISGGLQHGVKVKGKRYAVKEDSKLANMYNPLNRGQRLLQHVKKHDVDLYHELLDRVGSGYLTEAWTKQLVDFGTDVSGKKGQMGHELQIRMLREIFMSSSDHVAHLDRARLIGAAGLKTWRAGQAVGFGIARTIERNVRIAELGRADRAMATRVHGNWMKSIFLTPKALEETILRLEDTNVQRSLARNVNKILGDYTNMSPELRTATLSYSPFALWLRASTTWVLSLPKNSPARTAAVVAVNQMTEETRAALGLSMFRPREQGYKTGVKGKQEKATKPAYMQGSVPLSDGSLFPTKTLTSFGTFYDFGGDITDFVVPQITSAIMIGHGVYWNGEDLVYPDGSEPSGMEKAGIMLSNILETYMPAARWIKMAKNDGVPDETATLWGDKQVDTYLPPYAGANRYQASKTDWAASAFLPRIFSSVPKKGEKRPAANFGSPAESEGAMARKRNKLAAEDQENAIPGLDKDLGEVLKPDIIPGLDTGSTKTKKKKKPAGNYIPGLDD